jgi:uncharacterized protein with LGFP repeats
MRLLGPVHPLLALPVLAVLLPVTGAGAGPDAPDSAVVVAAAGDRELLPGETPVRSRVVGLTGRLAQHDGLRSTGPLALSGAKQVAVTWQAGQPAPEVEVRTRAASGWSSWTELEPFADSDADEGNGTTGTDLAWVGARRVVQVRIHGAVPRGLATVLIDPGHRNADAAPDAAAPAAAAAAPASRAAAYDLVAGTTDGEYRDTVLTSPPKTTFPTPHAPRPFIYTRHAWNADESLRPGPPEYSVTISQAHLHHTVSTNSYTRADVPAMIRGMYSYHVKSLGWNDIGYNFLVDKFGRVWEGRHGGITYPVRGAHTLGFNHRSVGISVIGNFETAQPTSELLSSVAKLAAWKLDLYSRPASGMTNRTSEGSDRFPNGDIVRLPVFDGHRDTNDTACPGKNLYARLPDLRRWAQRIEDKY